MQGGASSRRRCGLAFKLDRIEEYMAGLLLLLLLAVSAAGAELEKARDAQDRASLERIAGQFAVAAQKQANDDTAQYRFAQAQSYLAEVAVEMRDKNQARAAAETGIKAAERAVAIKPETSEYHRILGTLCGQAVSANVLAGMKYGRCAMDEVNKSIQLDPQSALNYLSQGIGNYYLPPAFGGGLEPAIKDFQKALELDPKSADAHLWLGLAFRKANRNPDARREFQKSLELNPARVWAKEQLDKTSAP